MAHRSGTKLLSFVLLAYIAMKIIANSLFVETNCINALPSPEKKLRLRNARKCF